MYGMGLRASPHPCAALSLRMNSYRSAEKSELEAFLSETRAKYDKSCKTLRHTFPATLLFFMSDTEMMAMDKLADVAEKIVHLRRRFKDTCREGETPPCLSHIIRGTVKLNDFVKRSDITMLKAVHMFFLGLIQDETVREYFKGYDNLLANEREFIHQFVGEATPEKRREVLLTKLEKSDFILPRLFAIYYVLKSRTIGVNDIKLLPYPNLRSYRRLSILRNSGTPNPRSLRTRTLDKQRKITASKLVAAAAPVRQLPLPTPTPRVKRPVTFIHYDQKRRKKKKRKDEQHDRVVLKAAQNL